MAISRSLRSWLLRDSDPSVVLRVRRELLDEPPSAPAVRSARAAIARKGWGASILAGQMPDGQWGTPGSAGRDLYRPKYFVTNWRLIVLGELGVPGTHPVVRRAVDLVLRRWDGADGAFGGTDSETCITGNWVRYMVRFGRGDDPRVPRAIDWLVRHQKSDGGWHCWPSRSGTLDAWEAMGAFAVLPPSLRSAAVDRAIARGAEFYLDRGLLREGRGTYAPWRRLHFPNHYYYDFLVGLDFLTALGYGDDRRLRPALDLLESKRRADGRWNLDAYHPDVDDPSYRPADPFFPFALELAGQPSRWITTTALVVLRRAGRG